jgi:hypothetical protein
VTGIADFVGTGRLSSMHGLEELESRERGTKIVERGAQAAAGVGGEGGRRRAWLPLPGELLASRGEGEPWSRARAYASGRGRRACGGSKGWCRGRGGERWGGRRSDRSAVGVGDGGSKRVELHSGTVGGVVRDSQAGHLLVCWAVL